MLLFALGFGLIFAAATQEIRRCSRTSPGAAAFILQISQSDPSQIPD